MKKSIKKLRKRAPTILHLSFCPNLTHVCGDGHFA